MRERKTERESEYDCRRKGEKCVLVQEAGSELN